MSNLIPVTGLVYNQNIKTWGSAEREHVQNLSLLREIPRATVQCLEVCNQTHARGCRNIIIPPSLLGKALPRLHPHVQCCVQLDARNYAQLYATWTGGNTALKWVFCFYCCNTLYLNLLHASHPHTHSKINPTPGCVVANWINRQHRPRPLLLGQITPLNPPLVINSRDDIEKFKIKNLISTELIMLCI